MKPINLDKAMKAYRDLEEKRKFEREVNGFGYDFQRKAAREHREAAEEATKVILRDIDSVISEEEGRATARTTNAYTILHILHKIEQKFGISQKAMQGIKVSCDPNAQSFPSAYKYTPESTQFTAEYRNRHWTLLEVTRSVCRSPGNKVIVQHTEESKAAIIDRMSAFSI